MQKSRHELEKTLARVGELVKAIHYKAKNVSFAANAQQEQAPAFTLGYIEQAAKHALRELGIEE